MVGAIPQEWQGGWMLHMAFSYKAKILYTSACFPMLEHTAFYFPPAAGWSPSLSREENVLHAFLCYTDRLEVCGWWVDKERFYKRALCNILLLSLIPT